MEVKNAVAGTLESGDIMIQIAEDLDSNGLGMFCTYDANDEPDGIDYQTLSVAALRLAQDAETRIDDLAQRLTQLEKRNQQ